MRRLDGERDQAPQEEKPVCRAMSLLTIVCLIPSSKNMGKNLTPSVPSAKYSEKTFLSGDQARKWRATDGIKQESWNQLICRGSGCPPTPQRDSCKASVWEDVSHGFSHPFRGFLPAVDCNGNMKSSRDQLKRT